MTPFETSESSIGPLAAPSVVITGVSPQKPHKLTRGFAGQFFVAGELSRLGLVAVITNGNCPHTDILCSNLRADRFVHIQVKTFRPGDATCSVGTKAESDYGDRFFWILAGVPEPGTAQQFMYYVIPSPILAPHIRADNEIGKTTPGRKGQQRNQENTFRAVTLPPRTDRTGWSIAEYRNAWQLIAEELT